MLRRHGVKFWLARPAVLDRPEPNTRVTPWTVDPEACGDVLIAIGAEWVRKDVGTTFVMNLQWALTAWLGEPGLHYLCAGYRRFVRHIRKYLRAMTTPIENDLPLAAIMQAIDAPLVITRPPAAHAATIQPPPDLHPRKEPR